MNEVRTKMFFDDENTGQAKKACSYTQGAPTSMTDATITMTKAESLFSSSVAMSEVQRTTSQRQNLVYPTSASTDGGGPDSFSVRTRKFAIQFAA